MMTEKQAAEIIDLLARISSHVNELGSDVRQSTTKLIGAIESLEAAITER